MEPHKLPVYQQKNKILKAINENQVVVIESPTGSGKTTQIPVILHEAGFSARGVIGVTQPRRIAAISVCEYIARQLGSNVPGLAGYKMRFNDMTSTDTLIKIMTDGILLQEIKTDILLSRYSCIIVDEAHERSLNIDFIMGLLKKVIEERPDFKVIISSATINSAVFSEYFGQCPVVRIDSIVYPVGITYDAVKKSGDIEELLLKINDIIDRVIEEKRKGDILLFLSGEGQIKSCITMLNSSPYRKQMVILPLYGRLSKEEQERVFIPTPPGKIKIIIATNIAETSVTIDGITTVIDSGLAKINTYSPKTYTSSLIESKISKASCNQRKGRAGRTMPGNCYRLYSKTDFESRPLFTQEEIYRTDLSEVVLRMAELGIKDFESFNFISSPGKQGIAGAVETLRLLDAINMDNLLTPTGEKMVIFPLLPRLSKMIVEAIINFPDVVEETILAATFLSTSSPLMLPQGEEFEARKAHHNFRDPDGDFISYIKTFRSYENSEDKALFCKKNYLDNIIMEELVNIKNQLEEIVGDTGIPITSGGSIRDYLVAISRGLIQFVCVKAGRGIYRSLTAEKIQIHPGSVMFKENPKYIVAGEIFRTSKMFAHSVSPLDREWLPLISPELADKFLAIDKTSDDITRKKDSGNNLKLGKDFFRLEKVQGKRNKCAILEWDRIKNLASSLNTGSLYIPHGLTGMIIYNNLEILSGEKLTNIIRVLPYLNPEKNFNVFNPGRGTINVNTDPRKLVNNLPAILTLAILKKKSKQIGFIALNTDNRGNYWFKPFKGFDYALSVSLSSLEQLMDELPDSEKLLNLNLNIESINKTYRKLTDILEEHGFSEEV